MKPYIRQDIANIKKLSISAAAFVASIGVVAVVWSEFIFFKDCRQRSWPNQLYNSSVWRSSSKDSRYIFINDIINSKILIGSDIQEVESELGEPDSKSGNYFEYIVRRFPEGGCGLNWLAILRLEIDSNGNVANASVVFD